MKFEEVVSTYIALRDQKQEMERECARAIAPINEAMEAAEQAMLGKLNEMGVSSLRTQYGNIIKAKKTSVSVADWETALGFIQAHDLWHMLERRIGKAATEQYIEEHGEPPPGVNVTTMFTVQFRRS